MREHCVISCTLPSVPRSPSPELVAGYHFNTPHTGLHSPASTRAWPACVLIWPSHLRSYTFCYTFLYVPDGHLIFLFMATLASCGDPETRLHVGSVSAPWPHVAISITFLYVPVYVPIRSGRPLHFTRLWQLIRCMPYAFQKVLSRSHTLGNGKIRERSAWASGPARCVG